MNSLHASVRYTLARLSIFAVCLGLAWLLGLRHDPILLVLVAATVSMILSLFLLRGMRAQFAEDLAARAQHRIEKRRRDGVLDDEVAEDHEVTQPGRLHEITRPDVEASEVQPERKQ